MFKSKRFSLLVGILALSSLLITGQDCAAQSDPCNPDPCQGTPNVVAGTCTPVGGACTPASDFFCSCDSGYVWQGATLTCELLPPTCHSAIDFPDPNLDQAVRQAIGKPTGDIYADDLIGFTSLRADNSGISNLSGLECFMSLTELRLEYNQIVDVSPLAGLTNLIRLFLQENQIVNVTPLAGLTNLIGLRLYNNQIVDMCPLVSNPGLVGIQDWVHLGTNPLSPTSCDVCVPQLEAKGVYVVDDCNAPL